MDHQPIDHVHSDNQCRIFDSLGIYSGQCEPNQKELGESNADIDRYRNNPCDCNIRNFGGFRNLYHELNVADYSIINERGI